MANPLPASALAPLFTDARTHRAWTDKPVSADVLRAVYDLTKWGPTSANCCPLRLVFVQSAAQKAKLVELVSRGNRASVEAAPVTALLAMDLEFYEHFDLLAPGSGAKSWFDPADERGVSDTALRNSSLQGGYFILAARALGLDCGPMGGFDAAAINAAFFAGTTYKISFICALGYADPSKVRPRAARFDFDQVATII
ncbi:MAG: malonic semialdehyde reductase [Elstera sp.]